MNQDLLRRLQPLNHTERGIYSLLSREGRDYATSRDLREPEWLAAEENLRRGSLVVPHRHPRFIRSGKHAHSRDYGNPLEMVYVCAGLRTLCIGERMVEQQAGELLIMNQHVQHYDLPLGQGDIAFGFLLRPDFFIAPLGAVGNENSQLHQLLSGSLSGSGQAGRYMHFKVAELPQIQNLIENLLWNYMDGIDDKNLNNMTMTLLFHMLFHFQDMAVSGCGGEDLKAKVLQYVEEHYADGTLSELARLLSYDLHWLSSDIKRMTGSTYTQLQQSKRISQAKHLLAATDLTVAEIAKKVGYSNTSYFHRLFQQQVGCSPRDYKWRT